MSDNFAIRVSNLSKCYQIYHQPQDRLKQFLWRGRRQYFREFWALHEISFEIMPGEVLGIIGRNGSGKSTLLQLICGTLTPSSGEVSVKGRVAALLELGAGFNPEFTGRENVFMSAAIMGLTQEEIAARFEDIVDFSGIRDFIDQPVKTYSSGMYVRLAFSVAISVDPDILVIDEALSVGDGLFARKSFERIMALKEQNKTILFCSHSLYQVEALCNRVLWLDNGAMRACGEPGVVNRAYGAFLDAEEGKGLQTQPPSTAEAATIASLPPSQPRMTSVELRVDGEVGATAWSGESTVSVTVHFVAAEIDGMSVAVGFFTQDGRCVTSTGSINDGVSLQVGTDGHGSATVVFERIALLKGIYSVTVWLLCDRALFVHEGVRDVCQLEVLQSDLSQGLVRLPHHWSVTKCADVAVSK